MSLRVPPGRVECSETGMCDFCGVVEFGADWIWGDVVADEVDLDG